MIAARTPMLLTVVAVALAAGAILSIKRTPPRAKTRQDSTAIKVLIDTFNAGDGDMKCVCVVGGPSMLSPQRIVLRHLRRVTADLRIEAMGNGERAGRTLDVAGTLGRRP